MLNYKYHKEASVCIPYDTKSYLNDIPERVTFLTFNQWKAFYHADPENWSVFERSKDGVTRHKYKMPVYNTRPNDKSRYHDGYIYIKFLTPYDYTQYLNYIDELVQAGEDYENAQEILTLSKIIQERSEKRLKKIQQELALAAEKNKKLYEKAKVAQVIQNGSFYK